MDAPRNAEANVRGAFLSAARHACACLALSVCLAVNASAQSTAAARLAILDAEEQGATSARDLMILRSGTHSADIQTVRMAVRALGRIERPSQIPDILPSL